ncbi:hypothetical protein [Streptomyces sp. NPDC090021]|uniref:hypothetical protein n=1 Tax=Streptomyces sp. NPDC090021 TaxID=3365919 RepID=UPI0037FA70C2
MTVDDEGNVRPDLTDVERRAFIHDPDGQALLASYNKAATSWAEQIKKYIQAFEETDTSVLRIDWGYFLHGRAALGDECL